jgi:hypothetical protein
MLGFVFVRRAFSLGHWVCASERGGICVV